MTMPAVPSALSDSSTSSQIRDTLREKLKGIKIGSKSYKISQFADDTVLFLRSLTELKYANRAIRKWCRATGMRENVKKKRRIGHGHTGGTRLRARYKMDPKR